MAPFSVVPCRARCVQPRSRLTTKSGTDARTTHREEAEARLARGPPPTASDQATPESLLELQVRQIELETQNEDLRRGMQALEEAHDRYLNLYEFAPVGYVTVNSDGKISEVNRAGEPIFGVDRSLHAHQPREAANRIGRKGRFQHVEHGTPVSVVGRTPASRIDATNARDDCEGLHDQGRPHERLLERNAGQSNRDATAPARASGLPTGPGVSSRRRSKTLAAQG